MNPDQFYGQCTDHFYFNFNDLMATAQWSTIELNIVRAFKNDCHKTEHKKHKMYAYFKWSGNILSKQQIYIL